MLDPKTLALAGGLLFWLTPGRKTETAPGTIEGAVRTASGAPLRGASVSVQGLRIRAVTGVDGKFILPNIPAGKQVVRAELLGYLVDSKQVTVMAGQTVSVALVLKPAPRLQSAAWSCCTPRRTPELDSPPARSTRSPAAARA